MNSFYSQEELTQIGFRHLGGCNILISRHASIYGAENISIGDNTRIDDFCILSGNITIGSHVHVAAFCALYGGNSGIEIEDFCGISSRTAIYADSDDYSGNFMTNPTVPDKYRSVYGGKVVFERHVLVGTGSTILPNVIIKEGCSIGSMSLVNKSLDEWGIYVGIPCRRIKERSKNLLNLENEFLSDH